MVPGVDAHWRSVLTVLTVGLRFEATEPVGDDIEAVAMSDSDEHRIRASGDRAHVDLAVRIPDVQNPIFIKVIGRRSEQSLVGVVAADGAARVLSTAVALLGLLGAAALTISIRWLVLGRSDPATRWFFLGWGACTTAFAAFWTHALKRAVAKSVAILAETYRTVSRA